MPNREDQLKRLLAQDPDDAFLLYALAQEYAKDGNHSGAVACYDRCLTSDESYCYAYYHKARSQQALGDLAGAVATLRSGLDQARAAGDEKAASEIEGLLDMLS
jgi:tetratricopeptide (TPR) repeat protein